MKKTSNIEGFINDLIKASAADKELREKLLKNPKGVIESRIGFKLPEEFKVMAHQDTPQKINIVLPLHSEELTEVELSAVSGGIDWSCTDQHRDTCGYDMPSDIKLKNNIADLDVYLK